jgi:hypothetical protein
VHATWSENLIINGSANYVFVRNDYATPLRTMYRSWQCYGLLGKIIIEMEALIDFCTATDGRYVRKWITNLLTVEK